jgi:hypothetical protein
MGSLIIDTLQNKKFISDNVNAWATIDLIRRNRESGVIPMSDEEWCDALGYGDDSLEKIISAIKSRRVGLTRSL